jgi:hypothetical protein
MSRRAKAQEPPWQPSHPVPWPDTGDPWLDLLRAAVESRLYPYGDLVSSPGRCVSSFQLLLLERGRVEGMDDEQVSRFLSANLFCGGNPVYRRDGATLQPAGFVALSGIWGEADVMGRRAFSRRLTVRGGSAGAPEAVWAGALAVEAFRRAFGVPYRDPAPVPNAGVRFEGAQGLLF